MTTERDYWLSITDDPDWKRNSIWDPNISAEETLEAVTAPFPARPKNILEIGCGYGRLTTQLQDKYPRAHVIGTDINPHVLAAAEPGPEYRCTDNLDDIPPQNSVCSVALFQHLPEPEKIGYINQAHTVLKPRGVFRVQFVEGDGDNFCAHLVQGKQMLQWCQEAGFKDASLDKGLAHPQWTWLTAVKR